MKKLICVFFVVVSISFSYGAESEDGYRKLPKMERLMPIPSRWLNDKEVYRLAHIGIFCVDESFTLICTDYGDYSTWKNPYTDRYLFSVSLFGGGCVPSMQYPETYNKIVTKDYIIETGMLPYGFIDPRGIAAPVATKYYDIKGVTTFFGVTVSIPKDTIIVTLYRDNKRYEPIRKVVYFKYAELLETQSDYAQSYDYNVRFHNAVKDISEVYGKPYFNKVVYKYPKKAKGKEFWEVFLNEQCWYEARWDLKKVTRVMVFNTNGLTITDTVKPEFCTVKTTK